MIRKFGVFFLMSFTFVMLALSGCYRVPVQQGNIITTTEINKLHNGMSSESVRNLLGTPVLVRVFEDNRIVYIYSFKPSIGNYQQKNMVLYFQNNRLTHYEWKEVNN